VPVHTRATRPRGQVELFSLAVGVVDMKVISGRPRHSDPRFTAAAQAHMLPDFAHGAAEATAAIVPLRRRETQAS
jgi:hypothetical protein